MDRLAAWVLRIGAVTLPLAFLWNIFDGFVLAKLLVARLLLLALAVLWVVRSARRGGLIVRRTALDLPLLAFAGSATLSTVFAVNRTVAVFGTYSRYEGLLTILMYVAVLWLVVQTLRDANDASAVVRALFVGAYLVSVIAILQSVFGSLAGGGGGGETAFSFGGLVRADATFGNPNALATFLAMLLPPALDEFITARGVSGRLLALNLLVVMSLALVLTFGRSAWVGAAIGMAMVLAARRPWRRPGAMAAVGTAAALFLVLAVGALFLHGGLPVVGSTTARALSIGDVVSGSASTRLHVWRDTLALVRSRPLTGYGPDTFGLVYPGFQTGDWTPGFLIDKAHSDLLQVAATQGLLGAAAYLWLVFAVIRAFWRGRAAPGAIGMFAGWLAYQVPTLVNFSFLPAAAPFWIFLAAAVTTWAGERGSLKDLPPPHTGESRAGTIRIIRVTALCAAALGLAALLAVPGVIRPYAADAWFFAGLGTQDTGRLEEARTDVAQARALAPEQSAYAVEAGNLALDLDADDTPAADADWESARQAYLAAARLGTFMPDAFRHLALADRALGRLDEAVAAARRAFELDRFDPRNQALLRQLRGP